MTTTPFPTLMLPAPTNRLALTLMTAVAPAVWGTTYIVTTELLPAGHPMFAALARALPAGILGLLLARELPHGSWWWKSMVLGTLNIGLFFSLLFVTAERLPGGVGATLGAAQPIQVAFLAVFLLSEPLSTWRLSWGLIGVLGVGLIVGGPEAGLDPVGIIAGLAGAASMSMGVVLTKRWGRPEGVCPIGFASWLLTAGGVVLLVPTLLIEGAPSMIDAPAATGYVWLASIGGLLAYTLWFNGVRTLPVTATALLGLLSPIVAAALGAIILGETLNPVQLIGFALALAALAAGQLTRPPSASKRTQPGPLPGTRSCAG